MVNSNENAIREAAYFLWQNNGCPSGRDQEFWAMAVDQLNSKSSCKSSVKKSCSSSKKSTTSSCKTATAKKTSSSKKSK